MPVSERQLIAPTLMLMAQPKYRDRGVTVGELEPYLRDLLQPDGRDLCALGNRSDDRFSQKVRNLVSHETIEKLGFARFVRDRRPGHLVITLAGLCAVERLLPFSNDNQLELPLR